MHDYVERVDLTAYKMKCNLSKINVLKAIYEERETLFGAFSERITKEITVKKWKEICEKGKALGIIQQEKDFTYCRDKFWPNIRNSTVVIIILIIIMIIGDWFTVYHRSASATFLQFEKEWSDIKQ